MQKKMNNPKHVGIIMDGNRRFAKSLNLNPWKGHEFGEKKLFSLLEWCKDLGVSEVTVYAFSIQNLNRPKQEFDYLMKLFYNSANKMLSDPRLDEEGVRVSVLGDTSFFPLEVQEKLKLLEDKSKNNANFLFNLALGYGGREEIIRAVKNIALLIESDKLRSSDVDEDLFKSHLYLSSEPDLIIRTGGDRRTSNFLPFQSTYSEWFFIDKTWPEFEKEDLVACIDEFKLRERRFGK